MESQNSIRQMTKEEQSESVAQLPGDAGECMRAQAQAGQLWVKGS